MSTKAKQKRWWVSWFHDSAYGAFEIHTPWWWTSDTAICAAVMAPDEDGAREAIFSAYDTRPSSLPWRFVEPKPDGWAPWNIDPGVEGTSRFQPKDWMQWPDS